MLTQAQIDKLRERPGLGWLSALRPEAIRKLIEKGCLERSLFDERNLAEITSPDFPKERLVACFNPMLEDRRRRKRESLLAATEKQFARIAAEVARRRKKPLTKAEIGVKTGKVLNKYKVGKHFTLTIEDGRFSWQRKQEEINEEAALDGIYVIRSSEPAEDLSADDAVRNYKRLGDVEQAFRTLKGLELLVRPIHHRVDDRVRAHLFVCLLAYYVAVASEAGVGMFPGRPASGISPANQGLLAHFSVHPLFVAIDALLGREPPRDLAARWS